MTKSSHLYRTMTALSLPLLCGNILQECYNTIDAFIVQRCSGQAEFAAIGVAGSIMNLFLFILTGCCAGFSVLFSHAYGSGDMRELRRQYLSALAAGLGCTTLLMFVGFFGLNPLLAALQTPAELQEPAILYLRWIFASLPAAFLYNLSASLLRACGDTRAALLVLAAAVGANLVLDLGFVAGLHLGIVGAAVATAATQVFSTLLCFLYLVRRYPDFLPRHGDGPLTRRRLLRTLRFGAVSGLHDCGLYLGKMLVQGTVNTAGTDVIAAYTAATRIEGFANSIGTSVSTATSIMTGQSSGAGEREQVEQTYRCSLRCTTVLGCAASVLLYVTAPAAIGLMLGTQTGLAFEEAVAYLRLVAAFYLFCYIGNTFAGYFSGIGRVAIPMVGALAHISLRVVLSRVLFPALELRAVAWATGIGWIFVNLFWWGIKKRSRTAQ